MSVTRERKKLKKRIVAALILAAAIFLLMLLAGYPRLIEKYYSEGFYPIICTLLHFIFNIFPFSVGDVLYIAVVIYLFYAAFRLIRLLLKKEFGYAGDFMLRLFIGMECAVLMFYLFWGMNYYRVPAGSRLGLNDTSYTTTGLVKITAMLIDSANASRARLKPSDLRHSNTAIYQTAITAVKKLSEVEPGFPARLPDIKSSLLTPLLNYMGTSGYYNPFTGEAQMDADMPVFTRPVTACHELSHQMGFGTEDEANFVGFLAGIKASDRLLRYSAYYLGVQEFMYALYFRDSTTAKKLKNLISPAVHRDFKAERDYWLSYQSRINTISSIFYNSFLKANNQPQGLDTYDRMVLLVMAYYRNNGLLPKSADAGTMPGYSTTPSAENFSCCSPPSTELP